MSQQPDPVVTDRQTLLSLVAEGFETRFLRFLFAGVNVTIPWVAPTDGFVLWLQSTGMTAYAKLNSNPSAPPVTTGVDDSYIFTAGSITGMLMRYPFKTNDIIYVRSESTGQCYLVVALKK